MSFKGKRVLVTGADGFIGSHLVDLLVQQQAEVTALVLYNSFNYWGCLEHSSSLKRVKILTGDIRDSHYCLALTKGIEVVFHLAALIPIPYSYRAPDSFIDTNIRGTLNLCQAALANGIERFIHTSTSEVYGTAQYLPIDEKHPLQAQSPYSASKIGADAIATSFYCSFDLPVIIARPFNSYGPRQSARAIIPTIIIQLQFGRDEIQLGDLSTSRDFTFVEDTCRGLLGLAAMERGAGEVFNIGSNQEITIAMLFEAIKDIMGRRSVAVTESVRLRPPNSEVLRLRCDGRKLESATGFRPAISLSEGLKRTIEWFSNAENLRLYKDIYNV
jgi:NAD dependent epimerase/dehydratase